MILDTTFLIDLYREARKGVEGPAANFLSAHGDEAAYISVVTVAEFAEGFPSTRREICADILKHYALLDVTEQVAWKYADVSRTLRERGQPVGDNDLWIAATALVHDYPVVTRNVTDFGRVANLRMLHY